MLQNLQVGPEFAAILYYLQKIGITSIWKITPMTILLVDDDDDDRKLFLDAAREVDHTITCLTASDGMDALDILKDTGSPVPDFIFLDLRMPGMGGKQCLEEIKKDPRLAAIPVIVYTTSRDVSEAIKLKKAGAAHFMSKPVFPDDVYFMISFVLGENWKFVGEVKN